MADVLSEAKDIIVVDDEQDICDMVAEILKEEGYKSRAFTSIFNAMQSIDEKLPDAVIFDIWFEGEDMDGLKALEIVKIRYPDVPVIMFSGHGSISTAIKALMMGAYDYIEKPFTEDRLKIVIKKALESNSLKKQNEELRMLIGDDCFFLGNSPAMNVLNSLILKVAPTSSRITITGETGSGKEMVARFIHSKSKRSASNFSVIRAGSLDSHELELVIFGEEANDPIEAKERKVGILEQVISGTCYIDEVTELPLEIQSKLVAVLQTQRFCRVGGSKEIKIDTRFMASSSRDLEIEVEAGRLRKDLFYRLNVIPIRVPSLSERAEDIKELSSIFINRICKSMCRQPKIISDEAIAVMQSYSWPGNIRQLKNVLERLIIMNPEIQVICARDLPEEMFSDKPCLFKLSESRENSAKVISMPLKCAREEFERQYLEAQLARFGGNISKTAKFIGMERSALHRKLKGLGLVRF